MGRIEPSKDDKIFCIGFHKCGTYTLHNLFAKSAKMSVHDSEFWNRSNKYNFDKGWLDGAEAFSDGYEKVNKITSMNYQTSSGCPIKAFKELKYVYPDLHLLEKYYPNAKFIFQDRDLRDFFYSRARMQNYTDCFGENFGDEQLEEWYFCYNYWKNYCLDYFKNKDNFLLINLCNGDDKNNLDKINEFLTTHIRELPKSNSTVGRYSTLPDDYRIMLEEKNKEKLKLIDLFLETKNHLK